MTKHLLAAVVLVLAAPVLGQGVTLHHVHGLAFSADGRQLFIPIHTGLAVYEDGRWSAAPGAGRLETGKSSMEELLRPG